MSLRDAPTRQGRGGGPQSGGNPRDPTAPDPAGYLGRFGEVISATGQNLKRLVKHLDRLQAKPA